MVKVQGNEISICWRKKRANQCSARKNNIKETQFIWREGGKCRKEVVSETRERKRKEKRGKYEDVKGNGKKVKDRDVESRKRPLMRNPCS